MPAHRTEPCQRFSPGCSDILGSAADAFREKTPLQRVPEARKGGEYKSPQTNVNDTDGSKIASLGTFRPSIQIAIQQHSCYYSDMSTVVHTDPEILGGTPCFAGTRVPIRSLFDHLKLGYSLDQFLEQFPTVKKTQAQTLLDEARTQIEEAAPKSAA
jgi:uncharacterized protein (DUF433 family)